jgi:hypothetical protein
MRDDDARTAVEPGGAGVQRANKRLARISRIMTTRPQIAVNKKVTGVASSRVKSESVKAAH